MINTNANPIAIPIPIPITNSTGNDTSEILFSLNSVFLVMISESFEIVFSITSRTDLVLFGRINSG